MILTLTVTAKKYPEATRVVTRHWVDEVPEMTFNINTVQKMHTMREVEKYMGQLAGHNLPLVGMKTLHGYVLTNMVIDRAADGGTRICYHKIKLTPEETVENLKLQVEKLKAKLVRVIEEAV